MEDYIELLTADEDGHAVKGMKFPRSLGSAKYFTSDEQVAVAHPHKFFRYSDMGRPMPETLVEFLVPEHLLNGGFPSELALRLVVERMGWARER